MTEVLETALKPLLKHIVREVAAEFMEEWKASVAHQPPHGAPNDGFLLTSRETAKRLAISERHLLQLTRTGQLPCVRVGKCVRYKIDTILEWLREAERMEHTAAVKRNESEQSASKQRVSASPGRKLNRTARPKPAGLPGENEPVPSRRSLHVRQLTSNVRPQELPGEKRISPLSKLLTEIGIERSSLPPITNGELTRIAEVDIHTLHGWQYLRRSLPEEAINRLKNFFLRAVTEQQTEA